MLKAGSVAPDFALAKTDGQSVKLQDAFARGPLLLIFFKISCSTSKFTLPYVERLHQHVLSHGGQAWGVSQDAPAPTRRFAQDCGVSFPIVIDEAPYPISRQYGLSYVPSLFVIGPDGRIAMSFDGFSKPNLVEAQHLIASHYSFDPPPLFAETEKVPQYKPG